MAARKSNRYCAHIKNRNPESVLVDDRPALKIPLSRGYFALIDPEDYELIRHRAWVVTINRYQQRYTHAFDRVEDGRKRHTSMHKVIMQPPAGMCVDHINGDGLDNRRCNLRVCRHQENIRNGRAHRDGSSRFKGVAWYKRDSRWRAYIVVDAKQIHLGYFDDDAEAARAYDHAARERFGEFARLNFPDPIAESRA